MKRSTQYLCSNPDYDIYIAIIKSQKIILRYTKSLPDVLNLAESEYVVYMYV